ncbi:MAG: glycosyltransferase [Novosphingobium sp.]
MSATPGAAPPISIVLCTHNRVGYLRSALESIFDQGETRHAYELILIDNCSSDGTAELGKAMARVGLLRYLPEPELGLCHARNTGWRNARGRYVAYFDDDALAEPGWIDAIADAFASTPTAGVVGGRVDPIWEAERPGWLSDSVALSLTIVDWSSEPKSIPDVRVEWLVGANMAVPRQILEEIGGFDPRLDRIGTHMLSGGDVFLQKAIVERGYGCLYYPAMAIRHLAARTRLNKPWFHARYYWQGISDAVMILITERPSPGRRFVMAAKSLGELLRHPGELWNLLGSSNDPAAFERRCFTLIHVGYIAGLLGKARA